MITHEDIKVVISLKVRCNKEVRKYLNDYITQQEKKDKLLELYRELRSLWIKGSVYELSLCLGKIKVLEEEMK